MYSFFIILSLSLAALHTKVVLAAPLDVSHAYSSAASEATGGPANNIANGLGGLSPSDDGLHARSKNASDVPGFIQGGHHRALRRHNEPTICQGNAYSGGGGNAPGGSVEGGLPGLNLINLLSNNGGDGGDASSGPAIAGGHGPGGYNGRGEKDDCGC